MNVHAHAAMERGARLEPWQYEQGDLAPQQVRVQVKACGVCWSDIDMIDDNRGLSSYPLVPGHEVVGLVDEVGSEVHHLKPGDRVGIGWQRSADLTCEECLGGNENLCENRRFTIVHGHGGFADHIILDGNFVYAWPDGLDPVKSAPLLCAGHAVYGALTAAGMSSGQEIGIVGMGGLGHLAIQYASKLGNRVTVFTSTPEKGDEAVKLGAHDVVVTDREDFQAPRKLDILHNTAPANLDWDRYLAQLGPDGTFVFSSNPPEPWNLTLGKLMAWRQRVMGNPTGGRALMREMLRIADQYEIEPVVETHPMEKVNDVLDRLRSHDVRYRAVLTR